MAKVTLEGTLGKDPEVKFSQNGSPRVTFSLAWSERQKDFATGEWMDGPTVWVQCTAFQDAEAIGAVLKKGNRVIVCGDLKPEEWSSSQGTDTVMTMVADRIGPSFRFQDLTVAKREKGAQQGGGFSARPQGNDPWNSAPPAGGFGNQPEEAPF